MDFDHLIAIICAKPFDVKFFQLLRFRRDTFDPVGKINIKSNVHSSITIITRRNSSKTCLTDFEAC